MTSKVSSAERVSFPETCSRPIKICWTASRRSASQTWLLLPLNCSSCLVITRPLSLRFKVKRAQRPSRDVSKPPRDISNVGMGSAYNGASRRLDLVPHKVSPYVIVPWKVGTCTHFHAPRRRATRRRSETCETGLPRPEHGQGGAVARRPRRIGLLSADNGLRTKATTLPIATARPIASSHRPTPRLTISITVVLPILRCGQ